jgi:oxygen-independent coproporphyrinogen-3 oxidase
VTPAFLYLHAPFCVRRCSYCDFAVTVERTPDPQPWLDAIEAELAAVVRHEGWGRLELQTIYVGGGTPSLLGPGVMAELCRRLRRYAGWDPATVEWTAEANPEHFRVDLAEAWRAAGVNRLSFGAQTFDAEVLQWMGRMHGPDGPVRALAVARAAGFDNVSLDLIFGLPARFNRDWTSDLRRVVDLGPEHLSLYGLAAEVATPLGRWVAEGRERLADEDAYAAEYLEAADLLAAAGYDHYEVSNFARPGRASRHNGAYWTGQAYIGLGPGAHSLLPPRRYWNVRDWLAYRDRVMATGNAVEGEETIDAAAAALERSWLGLRTRAGVTLRNNAEQALAWRWQNEGWAGCDGGILRLTPRGWLLLDRLAVEFAEVLKPAEDALTLKAWPATR